MKYILLIRIVSQDDNSSLYCSTPLLMLLVFVIQHVKIVTAPRSVESPKDKFEVFYIDYGNQEVVAYSQLRPLDNSVSSSPGLAQLCSLAYVKVPSLEEDYGQEAAIRLSEYTLNGPKEFKAVIVERDTSGGKVKGQGTGTVLMVSLIDPEANTSINALMLKVRIRPDIYSFMTSFHIVIH